MSYVALLAVEKSGLVKAYARAHNNHGFAPLVWDHLAKKYKIPSGPYGVMMDPKSRKATWALFCSGKLDPLDDFLMGATFDRVWIKRERLPMFIEALERFHVEFIQPGKYVETAKEMAEQLKKLYEEQPEGVGVALDQCSANDSWWYKKIPLGTDGEPLVGNGKAADYDEEPLNVLTDKLASNGKEFWEIYEHRDSVLAKSGS